MMKRIALPLLVALPLVGCSDSSPPAWPADAQLELTVDENAIVAAWPEAQDDKGIASYSVSIDGTPAAESGPDARNFKAMSTTLGSDHTFSVVARDNAGNETAPLEAKWEGKDMEAPEWPVGTLLQVKRTNPGAEPAEDGTVELKLTWPAAKDDSGVEFYRVLLVPTDVEDSMPRPKLIGLVKDGATELTTTGLASTKFQVSAVDAAENSSAPISNSLENPRRIDPLKPIKQISREDKIGNEETPKVDKAEAADKMAQ